MTGRRTATVLVNPAARGVQRGFDGQRIVAYLARQQVEARLVVPESPLEATRSAEAAAQRGDNLFFAVGGDGTVRDVALGLRGSKTALAAIPAGTVNIWAKEAGIPQGLRAALDSHIGGQVASMDLGLAGDRCFMLMAGIGWDAEIARRVSLPLKKRIGDLAYAVQTLRMLPGLRPRLARWSINGDELEAPLAWMVLGNTRLYGGRIRLTPAATITDGLLDMIALCPARVWDGARIAVRLAVGRAHGDRHVIEGQVPEVRIQTPGLAVQLDGDFAGETPMTFAVDPAALRVSVPAGALAPIFG
ncbi:MAG: hypothetical protein C0506_01005 [Anaerolinea sp.]|nr:hypothetical protein [Anaerolinea sp.]